MKKAFSLVELVVVLAVIAAITHVAVRELGTHRDVRLAQTADRQLAGFRDAVWSLEKDGTPCGFLADTGRMPRSLRELWERPANVRSYCVTNVAGVHVPTGWRGPYVRLAPGKSAVYDPWGNDFRIATNSFGYATNVCHMGASGLERTRSAGVSLVPDGGSLSSVVVMLPAPSPAGDTLRAYWPDGFGGVAEAMANISPGAQTARFDDIPPGTLIVAGAGKGSRMFRILPGDNIVQWQQ